MPSFFRSLALYALLAGALVAQVTNAYPQPALVRSEDAAIPHDTITTEPISMVRSIEDDGDLYQRSKPLKIAKEPTKSYSCPATNTPLDSSKLLLSRQPNTPMMASRLETVGLQPDS